MSLDSRAMLTALKDTASKIGAIDSVLGHEPKAAPSVTGVTCAIILMSARPTQSSGLASMSMVVEYWLRLYTSALQDPQDSIDVKVLDATDELLLAIAGQFTLGLSAVRYVDVLGSDSDGLRAEAGYLTQDSKPFRTMDVKVPIVINDAYSLVA